MYVNAKTIAYFLKWCILNILVTNTAERQQKLAETLVEKQPLFFISERVRKRKT